jgi:hypothetical protein
MAEEDPRREPTLRVLTTAENEPEASLICQRLADEDIPATQQTQPKKGRPIEIPVPKRATWERVLRRAARAPAKPNRDEQDDDR